MEQFQEQHYFGFHFDDDFLYLFNRDEQYTGGLEFEYIQRGQKTKIKRGLFNPYSNGARYWNLSLGTKLYTPNNLTDSLIILNDRPYSSYIYTSFGYSAFDSRKEKRLTIDLNLGVMGSELPGKVQDYIHQFGESPSANGWKNKLADRPYFIPNLHVNYQRNRITVGPINTWFLDWIQIATILDINTGLFMNNLKGGLKISGFNHQPTTASQIRFKTNNCKKTPKSYWKIGSYISPQVQFVAHNTTLQSLPWFNSPYIITPELVNRVVWAVEAGINMTYKRFHISYVIQSYTKEFTKFQHKWHNWAGVTIGKSF